MIFPIKYYASQKENEGAYMRTKGMESIGKTMETNLGP